MKPVLTVDDLGHTFASGSNTIQVLRDVSMNVNATEMVVIRGASGSGKTTLLLACGAMQAPTTGNVTVNDQNVFQLSPASRSQFRAREIGYLFQTLQLIPYLSLLGNIRIVRGVTTKTAKLWLKKVGLDDRAHHKPEALSHGQRQRAALARALAHRPKLVIADEPTGNLDPANAKMVFEALREFANEGGAVLVATHDDLVQSLADRTLQLESGFLKQTEYAS